MNAAWADAAISRLSDSTTCPVCEQSRLVEGCCGRCGADLRGAEGSALWSASVAAVEALRAREAARGRVPHAAPVPTAAGVVLPPVESSAGRPVAAASPGPAGLVAPPPAVRTGAPTDGASLQSVLATAGAALFAVAAIVFTFFNPELGDRAVRSWIIGGVTLVFLAGAWLLARRRLQSSAEAVGGLGLVFVGLDVQAVAGSFTGQGATWTSAALAALVAGGLMLAAGLRARIRIWVWTSLLALAAVPAMRGFGTSDDLGGALWLAVSGFAATGLMGLLPRLAPRFPMRRGAAGDTDAADAGIGTFTDAARADTAGADRPDAVGESAVPDERSASAVLAAPRRPLMPELAALTVLQVIVTALAAGRIVFTAGGAVPIAVVLAVLAVQAIVATTRTMAWAWSFVAGGLAVAAGAFAASALLSGGSRWVDWLATIVPAGAALVLLVCALVPLPRPTMRVPLSIGAGLAAGITSAPAVLSGAIIGSDLLRPAGEQAGRLTGSSVLGSLTWAGIVGLGVISAGFALFALCTRRRPDILSLRPAALVVAVLYATAAVLSLSAGRVLPLPLSIAVLLVVTAAAAFASARPAGSGWSSARLLLVAALHLALLISVALAWQDEAVVPYAGVGTLIALAVVARTTPVAARFLYAGAGYGYALALVGTAVSLAGVGGITLLSLVASAGLLGAVAATFLPIGARNWQAVLVVATVPFAIGVVQVAFERSGWTALSTGMMFALALVLLLTRRAGLTVVIRTLAAALLVPALSVTILCLGAQLLVRSGSPVVLPIIAVVVALVLPSGRMIRDALVARGRVAATADAARAAIEASALLTGAIAVILALLREAAGFGTACLVLILLGAGAALMSMLAGRRYGWWVSAAAFTGALWSLWALNGVGLPEAYLLPPSLGAAVVAVLLMLCGAPAVPLLAAGLAGAIVPVLALLIAADGTDAVPWRASALLAAGWALLGAAALVARAERPALRRLRPARTPAVLAASVAALGGTVQAVRWGSGLDASPVLGGAAGLFLLCVGLSAVSALALLLAARMLRSPASAVRLPRADALGAGGIAAEMSAERASPRGALGIPPRWLPVPGALAFAVGTWPAIAEDWFTIWGMWTLMLAWLAAMVASARRRPRDMLIPPAWVLFGIAFITAIVAWSPRELRVEMFSLPLGVLLLVAGAVGLRGEADAGRRTLRLDDWPHGTRSSWWRLAPGLIVLLSASIVSTFTDPLTWRAVLVMGLALAAILLGSARRLAAPFVIGLVVLPVENVFVFAVQIGRGIDSMPWWITLATVGAVLLIIAVAGERREGAGRGVAARMRDLR